MNANWSDEYIINRYLEGGLNEEETEFFNMRMQDENFKEKWSWMTGMKATKNEDGTNILRNEPITPDPSNTVPVEGKRQIGNAKWLIISATVILFVLLGYFTLFQNSPDSDQLFSQFFSPLPNTVDPIFNIEPDNLNTLSPFQLYEQGKYEEAISLFDRIGDDRPEAYFYKSLCFLSIGNIKDALLTMDVFDVSPTNELLQPAEWYRALAYVELNEYEKAREILAPVSLNADHPFKDLAGELLTYLRG